MAPHDTRNIFCNNEETELPVVFPHHLLMIAVASTASTKGTTTTTTTTTATTASKGCTTQEGMENSKPKSSSSQTPAEDSTKTAEVQTEEEEEQSEIRKIIEMTCTVVVDGSSSETKLNLLLRFEDQMNRKLSCSVSEDETGIDLANELVEYGLISELDRDKIANTIDEHLEIPSD